MVDIPVYNQHALFVEMLLGILGGNGHVVVNTEPHALILTTTKKQDKPYKDKTKKKKKKKEKKKNEKGGGGGKKMY